jgi:predicted restriction endonuclease
VLYQVSRRIRIPRYRRKSLTRIRAGAAYKIHLKRLGKLKCESCGWFDPLVLPFFRLETHHIKQVSNDGDHSFDNLVALCPTEHDLADRMSVKYKNTILNKEAFVALLREHEYLRQQEIARIKNY